MSKEIVVNVGERETRIAVLEDSRLAEIHYEREERVVGSLYKARVENVLPGMDAAFVDIGLNRNAFLYVGDVLPGLDGEGDVDTGADASREADAEAEQDEHADAPEAGEDGSSGDASSPAVLRRFQRVRKTLRRSALRRQRIDEVLRVGQEILVQVIKGPRGTKGARVSTRISLPGRYLVLMPEADTIGVSRKIVDPAERDRLKRIGERLREPGFGIIIRTEAEDKPEQDLVADMEFLVKLWRQIQDAAHRAKGPTLIHKDLTLIYKTIRDIFGSDVSRLVIDDPVEYEKANELLEMVSPKLRGRIHLYTGDTPILDHFNIEPEIERSMKRKVWLRSGGYLIIDETEALTVIDVNTGKFTGGSSLAETIVKTNIDAANEIARQLRLRDIGGIIVIDFIDMNHARDKQAVLRTLENALKKDRSRTKISSISALGLVEMTRKRTSETVVDFLTDACPACGGRGKIPSPETVSLLVEREMQRAAQSDKRNRDALLVTCNPAVAEVLVGADGENVDRLEQQLHRAIYVRGVTDCPIEKFDVTPGDVADLDRRVAGVKRGQVVECRVIRSTLQPEPAVIGLADGLILALDDGKKHVGQCVKARIAEVHRSYATAGVVPGTNRPLSGAEA